MATSYPPYAVWSDDDHSSAIIIVTTICLLYWLVPGIIQQGVSYSRSSRVSYSEGAFLASMVGHICPTLAIDWADPPDTGGGHTAILSAAERMSLRLGEVCEDTKQRTHSVGRACESRETGKGNGTPC